MAERRLRSHQERMEATHPEVLGVDGAARVLGVSRWLVLRLARRGEIPGRKIGREWRFRLSVILRWLGEGSARGEQDPLEALLASGRVDLGRGGNGRRR